MAKIKVMVVEDQFVARQLFEMYLQSSEKYEMVYAIESAAFADTFVLKNHIDLVLMDILMSDGSNGLDAAVRIKKNCPSIKIIAVTSMPETSWLDRAREIGIESFWYKEASKETILEVMDRTMEGESVYPDSPPKVRLGLASSTEFTGRETGSPSDYDYRRIQCRHSKKTEYFREYRKKPYSPYDGKNRL